GDLVGDLVPDPADALVVDRLDHEPDGLAGVALDLRPGRADAGRRIAEGLHDPVAQAGDRGRHPVAQVLRPVDDVVAHPLHGRFGAVAQAGDPDHHGVAHALDPARHGVPHVLDAVHRAVAHRLQAPDRTVAHALQPGHGPVAHFAEPPDRPVLDADEDSLEESADLRQEIPDGARQEPEHRARHRRQEFEGACSDVLDPVPGFTPVARQNARGDLEDSLDGLESALDGADHAVEVRGDPVEDLTAEEIPDFLDGVDEQADLAADPLQHDAAEIGDGAERVAKAACRVRHLVEGVAGPVGVLGAEFADRLADRGEQLAELAADLLQLLQPGPAQAAQLLAQPAARVGELVDAAGPAAAGEGRPQPVAGLLCPLGHTRQAGRELLQIAQDGAADGLDEGRLDAALEPLQPRAGGLAHFVADALGGPGHIPQGLDGLGRVQRI